MNPINKVVIEICFSRNQTEICKMVEEREENLNKVFSLLGIDKSDVFNCVYESASLVIALKDKKTVIEVCFAPQIILIDEDVEQTNPLWKEIQTMFSSN